MSSLILNSLLTPSRRTPSPSSASSIGGCAGTQFGCCQDGVTAARSLTDPCKGGSINPRTPSAQTNFIGASNIRPNGNASVIPNTNIITESGTGIGVATVPNTQVSNERVPGRTTGTQYPNFPLSTEEPLAPATLIESLEGPVNVLLGEESLAQDSRSAQGIAGSITSLDFISESTSRTICNSTSQLGALLCNELSLDPQGSIFSLTNVGSTSRDGCLASRYGCCSNGITRKLDNGGTNCVDSNFQRQCLPFGCCPGTNFGLKKANLIGTNCPRGAVPLVGWSGNSTEEQRNAAGVGYIDPRYRNNNNEFAAVTTGQFLTPGEATQFASVGEGRGLAN